MHLSPRLELVALSFDGAPIEKNPPRCQFGLDESILIGRSNDNHMVLADPTRCVSRTQARITCTDRGTAQLENISGSVSLFVNGEELLPNESLCISLNDKVFVGRYVLCLDPVLSPEHDVGQSSQYCEDDYSDGPPEVGEVYIPEDFDIFAEPSMDSGVSIDSSFELGDLEVNAQDAGPSLLEGLEDISGSVLMDKSSCGSDRLLREAQDCQDPLAAIVAGENSTKTIGDIFSGEGSIDHGSELSMAFTAPKAIRSDNSSPDVEIPVVAGLDIPQVDASQESRSVLKPVVSVADDGLVSGPEKTSDSVSGGANDDLRQVFSDACGVDIRHLPAFDAEFVANIGSILSHLTAGTINMVHERSVTKHEMRANVTIIASGGNNPLKFAPDTQSALRQLLGTTFSGFMDPVSAIREAYEDLSAHQIGLMMGARAAVYEVVNKFSPERLQRYLSTSKLMDTILPMSHKSRLWELYEKNYSELAGDAKEDFEVLFQQAFADAYEQEVERMNKMRGRG